MWGVCCNYAGGVWDVYDERVILLLRIASQAIKGWHLPKLNQVLQGDSQEVWDGKLQRGIHTNVHKLLYGWWLGWNSSRSNQIQRIDWFFALSHC